MKGESRQRQETLKRKMVREKGWFVPALHEKYLKNSRHL
jgi:hypothetical protein